MTRRSLSAILLRSHPYGDTSQILRFLTPDLGVVAVVAKGVRAQRSRGRGGGLELFALGSLDLDHRPGRALHGFRGFEVDPAWSVHGLAREMLALAGASYLSELILAHVVDEEAQPILFAYLAEVLRAMQAAESAALSGIFLRAGWGIVGLFGFPPALDRCVVCDAEVDLAGDAEPAEDVQLVRFDLQAGGVRCERCAPGGSGPRLGPLAMAGLRSLVSGEPGPPGNPPTRGALGLFRLFDRFARLHLGLERTFRSTDTVEESIRGLEPERP